MSLSIPGTVPVQLADTPAPASTPTKQAAEPQQSSDTVLLSQSAQINQLYLQGQSPQQIAENLGLAQSTVNSDLGVAATVLAAQPAAVATAVSAKGTSAT
jgi:DNA-binding CsgD family transcriptional regulator